ncbi:MAG: NYN domain-containing protein, partial [Pseudomonadota bacterium]
PSRTAQPALATPQPQVQPESDVRIEPSLSQPVAQSRQPSHAQAPSPLTSGVAAPSAYANGQPSGMPNANHQPEPQAYAQPQAVVHEQVPNAPSSGTLGRGDIGQERRIDADPSQPTQQVFSGAPQHERNTPVSKGPIEPAQASQPSQPRPAQTQPASGPSRESSASALQAAIARIHEACQAPPLSPPEYRVLFQVMAEEITNNGLTGSATLVNIAQRAQDNGVEVRRDDVRFVLEVVSEADPWFEQGASAALFASRFRNFVVARCRSQGLQLSADELDLIEAWFSSGAPRGSGPANRRTTGAAAGAGQPAQLQSAPAQAAPAQQANAPTAREGQSDGAWFGSGATGVRATNQDTHGEDDFPRILQKRAGG